MNHLVVRFLLHVHQVTLVAQTFTETSLLFDALNCIGQLLKDHYALTVDREPPTEVNFEVFGPFIDCLLIDGLRSR